jgi:glycosyltransferase involved in cell wall biosynthesis
MPKILRIINRLNLGGPTYNAAYLTKYLEPEYETMLLAGNKDESEASSEFIVTNLGLKASYIKGMFRSLHPIKDYQAYLEIKKIIKEVRPDIVHTHAAKAGALGRLAAIHCKVPIIVHTFHGHVFHSYFNKWVNRLFIKIEQYFAANSTAIIAISDLQKKELTQDFEICPAEKVTVVPLGFDLDRFTHNTSENRNHFRNCYDLSTDTIAVGIIGRLVPIKNHNMFLEVVKKVLEGCNEKVKFFIIGDGEDKAKLEAKATELQLTFDNFKWEENKNFHYPKTENPIVFASWIHNIPMALAGLDIVVMTSLNEGTPVSLIEALAANKPVVSTNVGGVANVVSHGETGFLTPSNAVDEFAQHLKNLIANKGLRSIMGSKGHTAVVNKYGYMRLVHDVDMLYKKLLAKAKT